MEIYVQSRGKTHDYCWIRITDNGQQQENPSIVKEVSDLIESDDFSLALGRFSNQLLLLVTGLKSERTDFPQRRIIRYSVAWVGQDSDEPVLRALAICALRDSLKEKIDQAVKFGGDSKEGFKVSFKEIQQLAGQVSVKNSPPDSKRFIGPNSELLKNRLAQELENYQLPKKQGPLVIVTGIKKEESLEKSGVWWGLSDLVKTEKEILDNPPKILQGFPTLKFTISITTAGLVAAMSVFVIWSTQVQKQQIFTFSAEQVQSLEVKTQQQTLELERIDETDLISQLWLVYYAHSPQTLTFSAEQVQSLEVKTQQQTLELERIDETDQPRWLMNGIPVNNKNVSSLIDWLVKRKSERILQVSENDLQKYNLDEPQACIDIKLKGKNLKDKEPHQLILGKQVSNSNSLYVEVDPSNKSSEKLNVLSVPLDFQNAINNLLPKPEAQNDTPSSNGETPAASTGEDSTKAIPSPRKDLKNICDKQLPEKTNREHPISVKR